MWKFSAGYSRRVGLPLTRKKLETLIAIEQQKTSFLLRLKSIILLCMATVVLSATAALLFLSFYDAPFSFSKQGWVNVRNLTPVVTIETDVSGILENIFVSQGQVVQKGELLGSIQIGAIELDYVGAQKKFADKVLELHCLMSLQLNKSSYSLPHEAQLLIDQMTTQSEISHKSKKCEKELLRNAIADQSIEETIAALEDQFRLLMHAIKNRILPIETIKTIPNTDAEKIEDQYRPVVEFARAQRELKITRKEYLLRKLQKEKELSSMIEQTIQEMRYLDKHLRELRQKMDDNFIYASITGTVVRSKVAKIGSTIKQHETIFELQSLEKEFEISIPIDKNDTRKINTKDPTTISFGNNQKSFGALTATTVAVQRQANGKLEAIMKISGNQKKNAEIIFASGYRDLGEQRLPAVITTGQTKAWESIMNIIFQRHIKPIFF